MADLEFKNEGVWQHFLREKGGQAAQCKLCKAKLKAEMAVFESSGKRGRSLQQAYQYLLTVPPTSVQAERAFSAAGVLCTKLHNHLQDKTLDTLCFLHAYYGHM